MCTWNLMHSHNLHLIPNRIVLAPQLRVHKPYQVASPRLPFLLFVLCMNFNLQRKTWHGSYIKNVLHSWSNIMNFQLILLQQIYSTLQKRSLRWRHNGRDGVSNHQPRDCLLNRLFKRRSKKTSKLRVTGLCEGNSPGTGEFPAQMASKPENVSIWWRHHGCFSLVLMEWKDWCLG